MIWRSLMIGVETPKSGLIVCKYKEYVDLEAKIDSNVADAPKPSFR